MCLLAILYKVVPGYPVVIAANRDELYDRQGAVPSLWQGLTPFCAPRDVRSGGTWIGCNSYEMVVAVTNRHRGAFDASKRSRGLLCADLLAAAFPNETAKLLRNELAGRDYNGVNVLCASPLQAFVASYDGVLELDALARGIHVLGNGDLNDEKSCRVRRTRRLLARADQENIRSLINDLKILCADHDAAGGEESICVHKPQVGTLSSTIIALADDPSKSIFLHAQGSPCATPYEDYSRLLRSNTVRARWRG